MDVIVVMDVADVADVVLRMASIDVGSTDLVRVREDSARVARVRSWLDAREIAGGRLEELRTPFGATPAIRGCGVRFEQSVLHHIRYREHRRPTDLGNLLPACSTHHHVVREGGRHISLHRITRDPAITDADGSIQTTGPPGARAG